MTGRGKATIAACVLASLVGRAAADPAPTLNFDEPIHLQSGSHVSTDGGSILDLPPGYFLAEPLWTKLDARVKQLQDDNTSKDAQIKVYKTEIEKWQPGWMTLVGAIAAGATLGYYIRGKL